MVFFKHIRTRERQADKRKRDGGMHRQARGQDIIDHKYVCGWKWLLWMYVCMYGWNVCMYMYVCVCMYVCMRGCMYERMYVCMYRNVCMYVFRSTHTHL